MMLLNHTYSPLSPEGTKQITQASLVKVADMDGYDGGSNILHHLEEGDPNQYVKPLFDYVSSCIRSKQKDLRNPSSIVVDTFNFPSFDSR
ncbi:hypothetical protein PM082_024411 [Marasmius tenuissimus]|nr:hypothetical protein PM082_024411 [Marasmius tenuissimus]